MNKEINEKTRENEMHEKTKEEHKFVAFTKEEKYNVIYYILGIMFFKFGFETIGYVLNLPRKK
jgi:hypothetical protein